MMVGEREMKFNVNSAFTQDQNSSSNNQPTPKLKNISNLPQHGQAMGKRRRIHYDFVFEIFEETYFKVWEKKTMSNLTPHITKSKMW